MNLLYLSVPGGGLDTNVRVLAPALARAGHRVSILYLHPARDVSPLDDPAIRIHHARVGNAHYYLARLLRRRTRLPMLVRALETAWALRQSLKKIARAEPFDLVELPEGFGIARLLRDVPYAMRLHSSAWMCRVLFNEPGLPSDPWERSAETEMLRGACGISSPSAFVADYIRAACRVQRPLEIIPYPIDTTQFVPAPNQREAQTILFVGRIEKRKGADVLLRAIPLVHQKFPNCQFIFAGSNSLSLEGRDEDTRSLSLKGDSSPRSSKTLSEANGEAEWGGRASAQNELEYENTGQQSLRRRARGEGPGESRGEGLGESRGEGVRFLGTLPRSELPSWYQRASIFVAPSFWDNSPNTIYEAMACGAPVVATRVGGIPELVDDGETGLLVPPSDEHALAAALIALLGDPARRERMGKCAREKAVAKFALEKIAGATLDFYQRALTIESNS